MEAAESVASVSPAVTHPKARRAPQRWVPAGSVTPEVDCNKAGPPQKERSVSTDATVRAECPEACPTAGKGFDEPELD